MGRLTDDNGVEFFYTAFPHEHGGGFSYNISMTGPKDIIHIDTKSGTVLTDEELIIFRAYYEIVRNHRERLTGTTIAIKPTEPEGSDADSDV